MADRTPHNLTPMAREGILARMLRKYAPSPIAPPAGELNYGDLDVQNQVFADMERLRRENFLSKYGATPEELKDRITPYRAGPPTIF